MGGRAWHLGSERAVSAATTIAVAWVTGAYEPYERFRPVVPAGVKGWGANGELDLDKLRSLARGR